MKKILFCIALALGCSALATPAQAQGLGGLLKKAKNVAEKGTKVADALLGDDSKKGAGKATYVTTNGISVFNPIVKSVFVEPVGLYGIPTSETKGNLYLVLRVTNKEDAQSLLIGSSIENKKMLASDNKGKIYNIDSSGAQRYDAPQDMTVQIVMEEPAMMFTNVSTDLEVMPMVSVGVSIDANHKGNLTFTNVPIYWNEEPE